MLIQIEVVVVDDNANVVDNDNVVVVVVVVSARITGGTGDFPSLRSSLFVFLPKGTVFLFVPGTAGAHVSLTSSSIFLCEKCIKMQSFTQNTKKNFWGGDT